METTTGAEGDPHTSLSGDHLIQSSESDTHHPTPTDSTIVDIVDTTIITTTSSCSSSSCQQQVNHNNNSNSTSHEGDTMLNSFVHYYPVVSGPSSRILTSPRPLVICGPSGSGKSTLLKKLLAEFADYFGFSVSHTTRKPRAGEVDGREYHFTDRDTMLQSIQRGEFIEHTSFSHNIYGTSKKSVQDVQDNGRICILDVEIEGVKNLKKTDLNPRFVFVKPPTIDVLEQRLRSRGTEKEEAILARLNQARIELAYGDFPGNFDIVLINDDIDEAYSNLRNFVLGDVEELKKSRGV